MVDLDRMNAARQCTPHNKKVPPEDKGCGLAWQCPIASLAGHAGHMERIHAPEIDGVLWGFIRMMYPWCP